MTAIEPSSVAAVVDPRRRYLPSTTADGYRIGGRETLAAALHRVTTEQFTVAIEALSDPRGTPTASAGRAVGAIERIASVLRLVRAVIGDAAYRTELTILSDVGVRLRSLLSGEPPVAALDLQLARYQHVLRPAALAEVREALVRRHQLRQLRALGDGAGEVPEQALHALRRARVRFAAWPIDGDDARMYGREPLPDTFDAIEEGLALTYRRARKHWRSVAKGTAAGDLASDGAQAESWQRETRRLGHQLDLLETVWPDVIGATARSCAQLDGVLTEASRHRALLTVLHDDPAVCPDPTEAALIDALGTHALDELHEVAVALGARLFVESTTRFMDRMSAYWLARDLTR